MRKIGLTVVVEALGAPGKVVDSAEGKSLKDVDVSWWKIDVRDERSHHFHRFSEAHRINDGYCKPHDNEQDQGSQIDQRYEELPWLMYIFCCFSDDVDGVIEQQSQNEHTIETQQGRCPVINNLESFVIVVHLQAPKDYAEDCYNIKEVYYVGNWQQHFFYIENIEDFVCAQLEVLSELEEVL